MRACRKDAIATTLNRFQGLHFEHSRHVSPRLVQLAKNLHRIFSPSPSSRPASQQHERFSPLTELCIRGSTDSTVLLRRVMQLAFLGRPEATGMHGWRQGLLIVVYLHFFGHGACWPYCGRMFFPLLFSTSQSVSLINALWTSAFLIKGRSAVYPSVFFLAFFAEFGCIQDVLFGSFFFFSFRLSAVTCNGSKWICISDTVFYMPLSAWGFDGWGMSVLSYLLTIPFLSSRFFLRTSICTYIYVFTNIAFHRREGWIFNPCDHITLDRNYY